jgi:hypothetical protein
MLAEGPVETYAMRDRELGASLEKGQLLECSGREDAEARMESWKYDPCVLAENGVANPCSLYLSLRRSGDERVQKEIQFLIERLPQWFEGFFREHFADYRKSFVLIGGVACHEWLATQGLEFRVTKDMDMVLIVEALEAAFVKPRSHLGRNPWIYGSLGRQSRPEKNQAK